MKITEIRKARHEIEAEVEAAKNAIEIARTKWKQLQRQCKHPKLRKYSACGETGNYCPDCGYQD
jgi:chromosome segregation ATPase